MTTDHRETRHGRHGGCGGGLGATAMGAKSAAAEAVAGGAALVHAHEQATQQGVKIIEVRLFTQE